MSTVMDIFDLAKTLSESDRARLTDLIANTIAKNENKNEVLTEKRFSNGVSTKYLNNYLIWNNILNYSKETWTEKKNIFEDFVFTTEKKVLCKNIRKRSAIPLLG